MYFCIERYDIGGGVADGKGDGATATENIQNSGQQVRNYDKNACDAK